MTLSIGALIFLIEMTQLSEGISLLRSRIS